MQTDLPTDEEIKQIFIDFENSVRNAMKAILPAAQGMIRAFQGPDLFIQNNNR